MQSARVATERVVIRVSGEDATRFLQDLVTNDITGKGCVYAALLSAQGKYLFDFFVTASEDGYLIDIDGARAQAFVMRLTMYRLRAKVEIAPTDLKLFHGLCEAPEGAQSDPRDPALGWRLIAAELDLTGIAELSDEDWRALCITHVIPRTDQDLIADDTYILEAGFERLSGVDFRKGCYVGQEVTARMKHKTELRKGLVRVSLEGPAPEPGTAITADGKPVGTLLSAAGSQALAHLRFDRARGEMRADGTRVIWAG